MNINWWQYHILNRHDSSTYVRCTWYTVISTFNSLLKFVLNILKPPSLKFQSLCVCMVCVIPLAFLWLLNKELSGLNCLHFISKGYDTFKTSSEYKMFETSKNTFNTCKNFWVQIQQYEYRNGNSWSVRLLLCREIQRVNFIFSTLYFHTSHKWYSHVQKIISVVTTWGSAKQSASSIRVSWVLVSLMP